MKNERDGPGQGFFLLKWCSGQDPGFCKVGDNLDYNRYYMNKDALKLN